MYLIRRGMEYTLMDAMKELNFACTALMRKSASALQNGQDFLNTPAIRNSVRRRITSLKNAQKRPLKLL